ncbi:F-actin-uncapping protein LRRC16A [Liparis tanakae]|uniref:F-actin-uncapping protein LRRC16A n=1 Tax=Liparis tanakae TaxID=230148 RepID=A0A4Z2FVF8_9TELE|nr:F-actin-uncapping protein LRRC16A [Liparis tanakae]
MGKLDEGLDDFFSKSVIKLSFRLPSARAPASGAQEAADKKRDSRKSGFFNLIKSRASRSEKSHGAASIAPPPHPPAAAASPSPSVAPVAEETSPPPPSPTAAAGNPVSVAEPHQELRRAASWDHADSETGSSPSAAEPPEEEEEEEERKENPHVVRHVGVPVMGMDLLAEMKARQERMAVKKAESSSLQDNDKDSRLAVPADADDESRPEPTPRSKAPSVTPRPPLGPRGSGPLSPASPTGPSGAATFDESAEAPTSPAKGPLPAPRLKRAPSEQERGSSCSSSSSSSSSAGPLSPLGGGFPADGDAFEPPGPPLDAGGRRSSSLKSAAGPPAAGQDHDPGQRAKSLPAYVRPPSLTDTDLRPAEEEVPSPAADLKLDDESDAV